MKIIAIMGSPRGKGSGYKIVKMIEERMKAMGKVEFEYLFLKDANLKPCLSCYNCMAKGEDKCPLKDDRAVIEQELLTADGFILSSPVYVSNVSWLMKNFIDRFAYMNHRPQFHRQKMLTVVNMGGTDNKGALTALKIAMWDTPGAPGLSTSLLSRRRRGRKQNARSQRRNGLYAFKTAFLKLFLKYLFMGDHSK